MKNTYAKRQTARVLLVALLALIIAGAAFAATRGFGILDFSQKYAEPLNPLPGAESEIATDLGRAEDELIAYSIREATCSGDRYSVLVHIEAVDPEHYALLDAWGDCATEDSGYVVESETMPDPLYPEQNILMQHFSRTDDKQILNVQIPSLTFEDERYDSGSQSINDRFNADGSIDYLVEGMLTQAAPETFGCKISAVYGIYGSEEMTTLDLGCTLSRMQDTLSAKLIPEGAGARWSIESASISSSKLKGTLNVDYLYTPAETGEDMGIDIHLMDENGNEITSGTGGTDTEEREDGTRVYHQTMEIQALDTLPEKLFLKAKIIGGDWLDAIECSVEMGE